MRNILSVISSKSFKKELLNKHRTSNFIYIVILFLLILSLVLVAYFNFNKKTGETDKATEENLQAYSLTFLNNRISIKFSANKSMIYNVQRENGSYSLPPLLKVTYRNSLKEILSTDYIKNSDGNDSATGCYTDPNNLYDVRGYKFKKQICYYNSINITKSGEYNSKISSLLSSSCFYEYPNKRGVIEFSTSAGADACEFILQNLKLLRFE